MKPIVLGRRLVPSAVAGLIFTLAVLGCGGSNTTINNLEGKITYKGADVTGGSIVFYPASGGPIPGYIKPDGSYIASDIPPGEVTVTIETASVQNTGKAILPPGGKMPPGGDAGKYPGANMPTGGKVIQIPAKYADRNKSGLKFTVGKGKVEKNFELTD
jgi:hypothetical protein